MKKSWIKRISRNPRRALLLRADTALQDYYRREHGGTPCEGCGERMALMHHFVLKSHSNHLRYEPKNLIFLCSICHSKVHGFHGELINATIILKRDGKWLADLRKMEREHMELGIKKLREIIESYQ